MSAQGRAQICMSGTDLMAYNIFPYMDQTYQWVLPKYKQHWSDGLQYGHDLTVITATHYSACDSSLFRSKVQINIYRCHCRCCCYCWQKNLKSNRHWINHSLSDKVAFRAVTGHLGWPTLLLEWEGMSWFCSCSWNKTLTVKSCIFT